MLFMRFPSEAPRTVVADVPDLRGSCSSLSRPNPVLRPGLAGGGPGSALWLSE